MSELNPEKMKVAELRDELEKRGLDTKGTKPFLVTRLQEALESEGGSVAGGQADMDMDSNEDPEAAGQEEVEEEEPAAAAAEPPTNGHGDEPAEEVNGDEKKEEATEVKTEVEAEKGKKRKFGESGLNMEELKPWNIREDEPELAEDFVCLDWYNSDLNLKIRHDDYLSGMPLNMESWSWMYAGCRATHGVKTGKVFFEVSYLDTMKVWTDKDGFHYDLRVGWSTNKSSRQLGDDCKGWCYSSSHGKKATNKEFTEYGAKIEKGDIVGAYLDYAEDNVTIQFTKNGEAQGEAFVFPAADLEGEALFPHICARNVRFQVNFGKVKDGKEREPLKPCEAIEGYTQIAKLEPDALVRGDARIATREECEFILVVGLPGSGKTTWARGYAAAHPEKKFEIINAAVFLEKATCEGESRKKHTEIVWEKVHHRITKALQDVLRVASTRRRNIILDQTNVYVDAQLRKARPFEKFGRKLVVVCPSEEDWQARRAKQEEEGEKNIPDESVNEMKANIAFPDEKTCESIFNEVIFTDLQREDAQTIMEGYNKEAQEAGFGKKHLEYQSQWEQNKRMRGFGPGFGRGNPRGGFMPRGMPRGGFRGGFMPRGGPRGGWGGGWGAPAYGGGGYGMPQRGGYGGYGGGWGGYGGGRGGGGYRGYGQQYPGNRNWGGY